jgi:predicted unusual protein kinase regulating ubiquinone biosynthesis (AarF/ABC1/UbiB family)
VAESAADTADAASAGVTETVEPVVVKPSSGLPDLAVVTEGTTPTAHLVVRDTGGGTDHVPPPRVFPRQLPPATAWDLATRGNLIAKSLARRFAPVALRQMRQIRQGALGADAFVRPLRLTFEDLGGTFMKFGQLIASSPGVFGEAVADEFRTCLDTGPIVGFKQIRDRIEADLGMSLEDAYASFDPEPVGRASIAVVHRAELHDGRVVGVKILRPLIHRVVSTDLDMLQPLLEIVANQTGDETAGWLLEMLDGFREQIGEELDLRNEARAMMHFKTLLAGADLPAIVVPTVIPEFSSRNVLTMEFLDGEPIDDLAAATRYGVDPAPLVAQIVRSFFLMTIKWGVFHGDVHAGNLMLLRDGRIGLLDWGIVGRLDADTHRFFVRVIEGSLGDEDAWDDVAAHLVKTYGPAIRDAMGLTDDQLSDFVRSLVEPVLTRPFGEVSLSTLIAAPQTQMARARGQRAQTGSIRSIIRRVREQRKLRRVTEAYGGMDSEFDRGSFLLAKQLMYFERYGKMFMADTPILSDRSFFESLVADAETQSPAAATAPAAAPS